MEWFYYHEDLDFTCKDEMFYVNEKKKKRIK